MRQVDGVLHDVDLVFQLRLDVDGRVGNQQGARIGRRVHHKNMADAPRGAQPSFGLHGRLHHLVGVQAALHQGLGAATAAHGHTQLGGLALAVGVDDGIGGDIQAYLCGQRLQRDLVADQSRLDEPLNRRFHRASERHVRQRPTDRRGDGRQLLAASQKLEKYVVIGGMADQRVNGNGFSQPCKIAH